jgi:hypothetical protein
MIASPLAGEVMTTTMVRRLLTLLLAVNIFVAGAPCAAGQDFDPGPWTADFRQMLAEMSLHHANLEYAVSQRRMDLAELRREGEARLQRARSAREAMEILERLGRFFGDGHIRLEWPPAASGGGSNSGSTGSPQPLCRRLGYTQRASPGLDFSHISGFAAAEDADAAYFPGGLLRLEGGEVFGIVRIGLFSEYAHPALCAEAQKERGLADDAECEEKCVWELELAVSDLLTAALERRLEALRQAGAAAILVDLVGNGGGTDWVEPAARTLTPVPLRSPRMGFLRHPHWTRQLRARLSELEADLATERTADRERMEEGARRLRQAIAESEKPCDRSAVWETGKLPGCSLVVADLLYTSGVFPYAGRDEFAGLNSRWVLFSFSRYRYTEGFSRLPLYVAVDGGTASAAEYFAAMLQDNRAATIVGTVTLGSGCGYTDGGIRTVLANSGARLHLPDCVRLRADGSNEVQGLAPDVLLPWGSRFSRHQQAEVLRDWLRTVRLAER